ncbi:MAG: serine protease, partial [Planctomycetota bacterium]
LAGLPKGVTSPAATQKVTGESTSVTFPITVAKDARVGLHKTLVCIVRVKRDGEVITQTTGSGQIRVDKPLPPKKDAPAKKSEPAKPKPATKKPLSRLEQLRQMKSQ